MTPFLCPHCGATKDRLRAVGIMDIDLGDDGPDRGFMFCKGCTTLIIWEIERGAQTVRRATADETQMVLTTLEGQASFTHALLSHMRTRR